MARLLTILFFLLVSLLGVIRAPAYHLWILSVIINGLPWLFVLATLVLITFLLFLSPMTMQTAFR